jgi:GT2 family glycosyltransferase
MNVPRISVILLNWNGLADTEECIESLQKSSMPVDIYVVDNASANNQSTILKNKFSAVRVLAQTDNLGFCKGNNVGIQQAINDGTDYVLILNNDTIVPPDAIEVLFNEFSTVAGIGALSPVILEYPAVDTVWFAKAVWDTRRAQFSLNPEKRAYKDLKKQAAPWYSQFACGCCLFTSAAILKEAGLLDERYFAYFDEADWCKRLERLHYKSYTTAKTIIYHKVSQSSPGLVSTYLMTRNRLLWMKENLSFGERLKSFTYLNKEFLWHLFNKWGLCRGAYTRAYSKAYLRGVFDYRLRRFGKWGKKTQAIIFKKK